jgi:tryptophan-rich sensory protein
MGYTIYMKSKVIELAKKHPYICAVIFYAIINLIAGYSVTMFVDINEAYKNLNTPSWAPATWVFGFAWTINNILILLGNIWTLESPSSYYRTLLIRTQILSWVNYAVFQWLSFGTGIPSMFFIPTFTMLVLTCFSIYFAYKIDIEKHTSIKASVLAKNSIVLTFLTLFSWLVLASMLGFYIMINN